MMQLLIQELKSTIIVIIVSRLTETCIYNFFPFAFKILSTSYQLKFSGSINVHAYALTVNEIDFHPFHNFYKINLLVLFDHRNLIII